MGVSVIISVPHLGGRGRCDLKLLKVKCSFLRIFLPNLKKNELH